ncbi:MAG: N-acetylmuramoyl-L-alanine amidase [Candidatus Omnitrophica bacterium]|nr:N-acetylmuramoyl-L-alanine amidase [Candidatus Omnitrophota bacterium]
MKFINKVLAVVFVTIFLAGCAAQAPYFKLDPSLQSSIRIIDGYKYLPLTRICDTYKVSCSWDTFAKTASLKAGSNNIVLRSESRIILINGKESKLDRPVVVTDGTVFVPVSFARKTIAPLSAAETAAPQKVPVIEAEKAFTIRTIALDTGHGGKDAGAIGRGRGTKEKDVALTLSKKVRNLLENAGIKVVMIRDNDTFVALPKRSVIANDSGADIFVSIHINASFSKLARGFECYYLSSATDDNARALEAFEDSSLKLSDDADAEHSRRLDKTLWDMTLTENRKESEELAGFICKSVDEEQLIKNNGVKSARFYVLKHTHIPSVLVESGYISNRIEEMKLRDQGFLDKMAEAIVRGILRYKKRYESTEGFTNV